MTYLAKETPIGVIDGVNKVFTLINTIDYITDVYINGAVYIDFTLSGQVITLSDAPTETLWVDYFSTQSIDNVQTDKKLGDVKTKIWDLLGQRATSTTFSPDILTREINNIMGPIWRGRVMNKLDKKYIQAGDLYFQENYYAFKTVEDSVVTQNVVVGDTRIYLNGSKLNASGWLLVGGDYIQYTSRTDTYIDGVSGIQTPHNEGVVVKQIYTLPVNYDIMLSMDEVNYFANSVRYTELDLDGYVSYDIVRVGTVPLIQMRGLCSNTIVRMKYRIKYVQITDDNADFPLPDEYGESVVAYIVAGMMAIDKMMPQGQTLLDTGYTNLVDMYSNYSKKIKKTTNFIRAKAYPTRGRIYR